MCVGVRQGFVCVCVLSIFFTPTLPPFHVLLHLCPPTVPLLFISLFTQNCSLHIFIILPISSLIGSNYFFLSVCSLILSSPFRPSFLLPIQSFSFSSLQTVITVINIFPLSPSLSSPPLPPSPTMFCLHLRIEQAA